MMGWGKKERYRGPSYVYKIRKIAESKTYGQVDGITIPRNIAQQFSGVPMQVTASGNGILLEPTKVNENKSRKSKAHILR